MQEWAEFFFQFSPSLFIFLLLELFPKSHLGNLGIFLFVLSNGNDKSKWEIS